jgi:endonuclease YncB( thermonuclease family)
MLRLDGLDAPERGHRPSLSPLEAAARQAQRGPWSGGFEPPAYWRRGS